MNDRKEKFTEGEWEAKTETFFGLQYAKVYIKRGGFDVSGAPDACANAHLIAAAPDMYKQLKEIQCFLIACSEGTMSRNNMENLAEELLDNTSKLLAKARGEEC